MKTNTTIYSFTFYSLCSQIAGSIFALITLLYMMHQNLLFICLREYTEQNTRFHNGYTTDVLPIVLTTVNDSLQNFLFYFFPPAASLYPHHLADHIHHLDILFCNYCEGFLLICFTSTICIETIHRLDMFLNRTFVPLL